MNRIALAAPLALLAACDVPLVMVEVDVPSACVTRVVDVDPLADPTIALSAADQLPSQMATDLSRRLGTTLDLKDNVVDLPAQAKGLLDLEVRFALVRITALAPHATALDDVSAFRVAVVPAAGSGLAPRELLAMTSNPSAPSGAPLEASGQGIDLAAYLYAGQIHFDYQVDAVIDETVAWQAEVTTCVAARGKVAVSYEDAKRL